MLRSEAQAGLAPCAEMRYVLAMTRPYDNLLMTQGGTAEATENLDEAIKQVHENLQNNFSEPLNMTVGRAVMDGIYATNGSGGNVPSPKRELFETQYNNYLTNHSPIAGYNPQLKAVLEASLGIVNATIKKYEWVADGYGNRCAVAGGLALHASGMPGLDPDKLKSGSTGSYRDVSALLEIIEASPQYAGKIAVNSISDVYTIYSSGLMENFIAIGMGTQNNDDPKKKVLTPAELAYIAYNDKQRISGI